MWNIYTEIATPEALTHTEILAYAQLMRMQLLRFEVRTLRSLDLVRMKVRHEQDRQSRSAR